MKYLKDVKIGDLIKYIGILLFEGLWLGACVLADELGLSVDSDFAGILLLACIGIFVNLVLGIAIETLKKRHIAVSSQKKVKA